MTRSKISQNKDFSSNLNKPPSNLTSKTNIQKIQDRKILSSKKHNSKNSSRNSLSMNRNMLSYPRSSTNSSKNLNHNVFLQNSQLGRLSNQSFMNKNQPNTYYKKNDSDFEELSDEDSDPGLNKPCRTSEQVSSITNNIQRLTNSSINPPQKFPELKNTYYKEDNDDISSESSKESYKLNNKPQTNYYKQESSQESSKSTEKPEKPIHSNKTLKKCFTLNEKSQSEQSNIFEDNINLRHRQNQDTNNQFDQGYLNTNPDTNRSDVNFITQNSDRNILYTKNSFEEDSFNDFNTYRDLKDDHTEKKNENNDDFHYDNRISINSNTLNKNTHTRISHFSKTDNNHNNDYTQAMKKRIYEDDADDINL